VLSSLRSPRLDDQGVPILGWPPEQNAGSAAHHQARLFPVVCGPHSHAVSRVLAAERRKDAGLHPPCEVIRSLVARLSHGTCNFATFASRWRTSRSYGTIRNAGERSEAIAGEDGRNYGSARVPARLGWRRLAARSGAGLLRECRRLDSGVRCEAVSERETCYNRSPEITDARQIETRNCFGAGGTPIANPNPERSAFRLLDLPFFR
jgi:hypothetical protein